MAVGSGPAIGEAGAAVPLQPRELSPHLRVLSSQILVGLRLSPRLLKNVPQLLSRGFPEGSGLPEHARMASASRPLQPSLTCPPGSYRCGRASRPSPARPSLPRPWFRRERLPRPLAAAVSCLLRTPKCRSL
jgi:hypothetical protein